MTNLEVRRPPFVFADDVPFLWNPELPAFSTLLNAVSFLAIAFEKYLVSATRQAMPRIADPAVAAEAEAFVRQEGQHAAMHRRHVAALCRVHPGLESTLDEAIASYDALLASHPLEYHLGYVANLESTFTPAFSMLLDHEVELFRGGDERVASLFLWHFVEEIEHRRSALLIYREVVGGDARRLRLLPSMASHLHRLFRTTAEGFNLHVPHAQRLVDARVIVPTLRSRGPDDPYARVPPASQRRARLGLVRALMPSHDPGNLPLPPFAALWLARYRRGDDVTRWYSSMVPSSGR